MSATSHPVLHNSTSSARPTGRDRSRVGRSVVGGFYLMMAGVHLGIVAADAETYRGFADGGLFAFVRDG
ncbi:MULTISPECIES: hypothetical protein [Nocardioides]|uniref:Uncharacterized protein n=1 Tax=Nocardioides vastitatis TaxID=2568655 RepID=A0ABW0ZIR9_9ACTN|nr:hypothetical protein [Nocardioides sp.]THJ06219.1 hypothetical protein E7Z54_06275 [Nocardioides sp.]